jgi:hypothetical protein
MVCQCDINLCQKYLYDLLQFGVHIFSKCDICNFVYGISLDVYLLKMQVLDKMLYFAKQKDVTIITLHEGIIFLLIVC